MHNDLIAWFWLEFDAFRKEQSGLWDAPPVQGRKKQHKDWRGMCQCETERFITSSENPKKMRAFYLLAVFLDQMVYTHLQPLYSRFHKRFPLPKLFAHLSMTNHAGPNWFIYSKRGWGNKMNWSVAKEVADELFGGFYTWLASLPVGEKKIARFRELARQEIANTFEERHQEKLMKVLDL